MTKILFVCSGNVDRSPTAEAIYKNHPELEVKSAGAGWNPYQRVNEELLQWADVVLCMEEWHKQTIMKDYGNVIAGKRIDYLDIEDDYPCVHPQLIKIIKEKVDTWLRENLLNIVETCKSH